MPLISQTNIFQYSLAMVYNYSSWLTEYSPNRNIKYYICSFNS